MLFNWIVFALGRKLVLDAGEDINRANQLALMAGMMGSSLLSPLIVQRVAQNEVAAKTPPATTASPAPLPGNTVSSGKTIRMPHVATTRTGKTRFLDEAMRELEKHRFQNIDTSPVFIPTADANVVIAQDPAPGTQVVPAQTTVTLTVTAESLARVSAS
jgi:hypothetical protein